MDVQGIEWISNLVRHPCGEQRKRGQLLRLNGLLRRAPRLRDIAQDHRIVHLLRRGHAGPFARNGVEPQRHDVKIQKPMLRVKHLHVAGHHFSRLHQRCPIQPAQTFGQRLTHAGLALQAEEGAGGAIQIGNAPADVGHDHPLVDGIENRLQKTLLIGQPQQIALHILRAHAPETFDKLVEKPGIHARLVAGFSEPSSSTSKGSDTSSAKRSWGQMTFHHEES